jgi:hypothetical protein
MKQPCGTIKEHVWNKFGTSLKQVLFRNPLAHRGFKD